jgi:hypothetical protein
MRIFFTSLLIFLGFSDLALGQCTACSEPGTSFATENLLVCQDFNTLPLGIQPNSTGANWRLLAGHTWPLVANNNTGNRQLSFNSANSPVGAFFGFGNQFSSRWRVSFKVFANKGKFTFSLLHDQDVSNNANAAYHLTITNSGYKLVLGKEDGPVYIDSTDFSTSYKIAQIIDIGKDQVELFVNDKFIYAWQFSIGSRVPSSTLGAMRFKAEAGANFAIDDLCVRNNNTQRVTQNLAPVCTKSGAHYDNSSAASQTGLYSNAELAPNCSDNCISCAAEKSLFFHAYLQQCENFYNTPSSFAFNTPNWKPWSTPVSNASVETPLGTNNPRLRFTGTSTRNPDGLYLLGNQTSSRYRISFKMEVRQGRAGYFNMQHNQLGGNNGNWAYEVFFGSNGQARVEVKDRVLVNFSYPQGLPMKVVQIIDLNEDKAEIWINNVFLAKWRFSQGSVRDEKVMGALNFYAANGSDFAIDDICVLKRGKAEVKLGPAVCIKNGDIALSASEAREVYLYGPDEFSTTCNLPAPVSPSVCDYGEMVLGLNNKKAKVKFSAADRLPESFFQAPCVARDWSVEQGRNLYGKVLIYDQLGGPITLSHSSSNPNAKPLSFYLFSCKCTNPAQACQYDCIPGRKMNDPNGSGSKNQANGMYYENIPQGFYYLLLLSSDTTEYTINTFCARFDILNLDQAMAQLRSDTIINEGCTPCGEDKGFELTLNQSKNDVLLTNDYINVGSGPYRNAPTNRIYEGKDNLYKFTLNTPSIVTVSLDQNTTPMGFFLYDYDCGSNLMGVAEIPSPNGRAVLGPMRLPAGTYHLIVDEMVRGTINPSMRILVETETDQDPAFYNPNATCPINLNNKQEVQVNLDFNSSSVNGTRLRTNDKINFFYRNAAGALVFANGQTIRDKTPLKFTLFADQINDNLKCGFGEGETYALKLSRGNQTWDLVPTFDVGGTNQSGQFRSNTNSTLNRVTAVQRPTYLEIIPAQLQIADAGGAIAANIITNNIAWRLIPTPGGFSTTQLNSGTGPQEVSISVARNPFAHPRADTLRLVGPNSELRNMIIRQNACTGASANLGPDTALCQGTNFNLVARGTGTRYLWSTGANTSSIPVAYNEKVQTFTVSITNGNCTAVDEIVVRPMPSATLRADKQVICQGDSLTLIAGGGSTYRWSPGQQTSAIIRVAPQSNATYTVEVKNRHCSKVLSIPVVVNPSFNASISPPISICQGDTTTLAVEGGSTYRWSTGVQASQVKVSPASDAQYMVTVSQNGCTKVLNSQVQVRLRPQVKLGPDTSLCFGQTYTLSAPMTGNFKWSTGDSTRQITLQNLAEPLLIKLEAEQNGCKASDEVRVRTLPALTLSVDKPSICEGDTATLVVSGGLLYEWSSGEKNNSIRVSPARDQVYTVKVRQKNCLDTLRSMIQVRPKPQVNLGRDTSLCFGQTYTLSAPAESTFTWSSGDTSRRISIKNLTAPFTVKLVATQNACTASDEVTLRPMPVPKVLVDKPQICLGESVELEGTGGEFYRWLKPRGVGRGVLVSPTESDTFSVRIINRHCDQVVHVPIQVDSLPRVSAGEDLEICLGDTAILLASGGSAYRWLHDGSTQAQIKVSPTNDNLYKVAIAKNACRDTAEVQVMVLSRPLAHAGPDTSLACDSNFVSLDAQLIFAQNTALFSWISPSDTAIVSGANTLLPRVQSAGTYVLHVRDSLTGCLSIDSVLVTKDTCLDTLSLQALGPVSIQQGNGMLKNRLPEQAWQLYPNPNDGDFFLALHLSSPSEVAIEVRDAQGRLVHRTQQSDVWRENIHLELQHLAAGTYNLRLQAGQLWGAKQFTILR